MYDTTLTTNKIDNITETCSSENCLLNKELETNLYNDSQESSFKSNNLEK